MRFEWELCGCRCWCRGCVLPCETFGIGKEIRQRHGTGVGLPFTMAQLVNITPLRIWFMITIVYSLHGVYKPTNITGAPHCTWWSWKKLPAKKQSRRRNDEDSPPVDSGRGLTLGTGSGDPLPGLMWNISVLKKHRQRFGVLTMKVTGFPWVSYKCSLPPMLGFLNESSLERQRRSADLIPEIKIYIKMWSKHLYALWIQTLSEKLLNPLVIIPQVLPKNILGSIGMRILAWYGNSSMHTEDT